MTTGEIFYRLLNLCNDEMQKNVSVAVYPRLMAV